MRWTPRRKEAVVKTYREHPENLAQIARECQASEDEILGWDRLFEAHGKDGLMLKFFREHRKETKL